MYLVNETVIPLVLVEYEMIIANSALPAYQLISSARSWIIGIFSLLNSLFFFLQQSLQPKFLPTANKLHQLGFTLYATEATAQYLNEHNIPAEPVEWPLHNVGVNPTATR